MFLTEMHTALPTQAYLPLLHITVTCSYSQMLSNIRNGRDSSVRLSYRRLRITGLYVQKKKTHFFSVTNISRLMVYILLMAGKARWVRVTANTRNNNICCVFFRTGLVYSDRQTTEFCNPVIRPGSKFANNIKTQICRVAGEGRGGDTDRLSTTLLRG
jgi:hypothetical protein